MDLVKEIFGAIHSPPEASDMQVRVRLGRMGVPAPVLAHDDNLRSLAALVDLTRSNLLVRDALYAPNAMPEDMTRVPAAKATATMGPCHITGNNRPCRIDCTTVETARKGPYISLLP